MTPPTDKDVTFQVVDIKHGTTVDGPGFRTSIYFAGCSHHCPECHNPHTWDGDAGTTYTLSELMQIIRENAMPVTFSGGDPLFRPLQLLELARKLRQEKYDIWCYTGYTFEALLNDPIRRKLLDYINVLVDGPFVTAQRDTSLLFRGSSNQRIIDVGATMVNSEITLWESDF